MSEDNPFAPPIAQTVTPPPTIQPSVETAELSELFEGIFRIVGNHPGRALAALVTATIGGQLVAGILIALPIAKDSDGLPVDALGWAVFVPSIAIAVLASLWLQLGAIRVWVESHQGRAAPLTDLFGQARATVRTVFVYLAAMIAILGGFCLFAIPGFYIACATALVLPVSLYEGGGLRQSARRSEELMQGNKVMFLLFSLAMGIVISVGASVVDFIVGVPVFGLLAALLLWPLCLLSQSALYGVLAKPPAIT